MTYNLDKTSLSIFGFILDDSQKIALETIIQFLLNDDNNDIVKVVSGYPGVGKSSIAAVLINILKQNNILSYVITPTNKSKNVLGKYIGDQNLVMTIHSFLNLRPNLNILDFDAKDMQFKIDFHVFEPQPKSVFIVDEGSMINDELYDILTEKARNKRSKILIFCDIKQLAPVNQDKMSKVLNQDKIELTTVHRQKDENSIHNVLNYLRKKPIYKFKTYGENLIVYNDFKSLLQEKAPIFKLASDLKNSNIIKLITYTNKRIEILNQYIRNLIYNDKSEYHIGEILTGYDSCTCGTYEIFNSSDYIVISCTPSL